MSTQEWKDLAEEKGRDVPECECRTPAISHTVLLHWWENSSQAARLTRRETMAANQPERSVNR